LAEVAKMQLYSSINKSYATAQPVSVQPSQLLEGSAYESQIADEAKKESQMLDLINRVQMF
jgi:hypothetical protein